MAGSTNSAAGAGGATFVDSGAEAAGGRAEDPLTDTVDASATGGNNGSIDAGMGNARESVDGGVINGEVVPWVGTWGASPQLTEPNNNPPVALGDSSLRQFASVSIGGGQLRVQLSNEFGDGPVTFRSVHLADAAGPPAIASATDIALTFGGVSSVTLAAGQSLYSDSFSFSLESQSIVALTVAFGDVPQGITGHPGSRTTSYIADGNAVGEVTLPAATSTNHWYYWSKIEVVAPLSPGAVVVLGDSISDGRGSTNNANDRWTDAFSRRLRANANTSQVAVINAAIGGNSVLSGGNGPPAIDRFSRDILGQAGVRWVVILEGVNDIGEGAIVVEQLIAAYQGFIAEAHAAGALVYASPILPFAGSGYDSDANQAERQELNDWILTSNQFDAVLRLDEAVADPADSARLLPAYDDGDQLHLTPAGYQAMADAIDLSLFE